MIDALAYTSERLPPITGPRAPRDRKPKKRKASGGVLPAGLFPAGSALMVSQGIYDELRSISSLAFPRPLDPLRGIADPYYFGYPIYPSTRLESAFLGGGA